ncbi:uncharacterized protein LOC127452307 [Myxocyprinus asiaticus]|uniref:uncharacterized protein LOC127452307 n=1 Tax=Myxocyprinus asiaticus TaxID=70543 RepID=UPI0022235C35|nr:uncharacterized protein LOC127452307 [Myxocyprinus asiaticus]
MRRNELRTKAVNTLISHSSEHLFLTTYNLFWKTMLVILAFLIIHLNSVNCEGAIELHTYKKQMINCNEKTVLQCNISSSRNFDIIYTHWKKDKDNFECYPRSSEGPSGFECNYTKEILTLTILRPTPANMGTYFCNLRTNTGHDSENINVFIGGECIGEFSHQMVGSNQMQCSFNGIYPDGIINWFQNDKNLTSYSNITRHQTNSDGTFSITSILNIQDKQERYNCSLWSLKNGQYLKIQQFEVPDVISSPISRMSRLNCLHWLLLPFGLILSLRTYLFL